MTRDELGAWLRLALTPGIGPTTARRLLAAFGLPQQLFDQPASAWAQVASPAQTQALQKIPEGLDNQLETTWQWLQPSPEAPAGRYLLTLSDPAYPAALLNTEDPPLMLYLSSPPPAAWPAGVAVVGSRNPTAQGAANARQFARSLAQAGLVVVSGLALGVDGAAHEGALEGASDGQAATIAVVGTGLDRVYPKRHLELAHRIAARGWLVSEFHLGTGPLAENFPRRNRIISALGLGTLVVEAALQSGSLITARFAVEQGKDVFAIPGSIHSPQSRGCHALLKQGAKLVETAQDVLEELRLAVGSDRGDAVPAPSPAHDAGGSLLAALGYDPVGLDALIARTGIPASGLQARLLELELQGEVARLPGGLYQRCSTA